MASIARKNLFEDVPRFMVAQAGILFAVSLVTIQAGILKGFTHSTTLLIEHSQADIWLGSTKMAHFELSEPLKLEQLVEARKVSGVQRAEPLWLTGARWISTDGTVVPLRVFGFNPAGRLFVPGILTQGQVRNLKQPYSVLVDETNIKKLGLAQLGDAGEINGLTAQVVGLTKGTQSVASSAYIFTSLETGKAFVSTGLTASLNCQIQALGDIECRNKFDREDLDPLEIAQPPLEPLTEADRITYILIQKAPGETIQNLKQRLEAAIPNVLAYSQAEMVKHTQKYWQSRTGIGFILGLGAGVGIIVGIVIVGQILYASVSDHLKEFGTLKAMGASDWLIYRIILEQALWMAVLGYVPGMVLCWGVSSWAFASQGIMILITPGTAAGAFIVTVLMCVSSALFAIQKVTRVDPAIVFKA